jgi:septal ring factor EnvC (AmiA/AmiB activator)
MKTETSGFIQVGEAVAQPESVVTSPASTTVVGTKPQVVRQTRDERDLAYWRKMAIETGRRVEILETQSKDLRTAADDARARFSKYKGRLDKAQSRINELEVERIKLAAQRDELRGQLAQQAKVAKLVHEFRQSVMDGPLWSLFVELSVSPAVEPGGEQG